MKLNYFNPHEFTRSGVEWFDKISPELLVRLDCLRGVWGAPIHISKHPRAVGRRDPIRQGFDGHNLNKHDKVMAVDVFPEMVYSPKYFLESAEDVGFRGIGYYPQWKQGNLKGGFHVDVRDSERATWGYVDGKFVSISDALNFRL